MVPDYKRTKLACYTAYFTMSSIFCVPSLLFVTLHEMYGVSYTLLGMLVSINFCAQLCMDLLFTLFSHRFPVQTIVRIMPLITTAGLLTYALIPMLFPSHAYIGLVIGTAIFSVSAGFSEALLSPLIAALPSENPQKDMSFLHSLYAFGVVTMVVVSTLFLNLFGSENWMYLVMILACLPIFGAVLFMCSPIPNLQNEAATGQTAEQNKKRIIGLALCVGCIFFGSCAENVMSNWLSSYMEIALGIDKVWGDILGVAMFAVLLGAGRVLYSKFGKNICRVMLLGMIGSFACYLIAGLSPNMTVAMVACSVTGFCTAMLWPGTLIMLEEYIPYAGVAAFSLMAAGGDFGAAVGPQLMGVVVDKVSASAFAADLGMKLGFSADQIGMKAGMLIAAVFPILGTVVLAVAIRYFQVRLRSKKVKVLSE